jgi:hypothetical protein
MTETFIAQKDKVEYCSVCNAKKRLTTSKNGNRYWKYDILIMEQGTHKHKWVMKNETD